MSPADTTLDGVRLLSHRPSVLYKVEHLATEPVDGDIAVEGLVLAGPGWNERLKELLERRLDRRARVPVRARASSDEQALPLPAEQLLDRARTDWFPEFLSHGQMKPHFQPIVELATGRVYGREALMRGQLGAVEVRGGELLAAAEAHDALFSFDYRARTAALEVGLPLLPEGEVLFVNLDPRAVARRRARPCGPPGRSSRGWTPTRRGSASSSSSPSAARTARCSPRSSRPTASAAR